MNNWQIKKLGEVCDFQGGSQPPKSDFIFSPQKGYVRFLQIRDFGSDKNITYIPESKKNRLCNTDDILLGRYGASVGKVLINKNGAYNVAIMKSIPDHNLIVKRYFYYYLLSNEFQSRLLKVASRSAQAGFSKADIYNFPILTPSVSEQKRIVKTLDQVFENINKAKENTEKNLFNCRQLFEKYSHTMFLDVDKNEETKNMGEICDFLNGYAFKSSDAVNLSNTQLIRMGNLYKNNLDLERRAVYYPNDFSEKYKRYLLSNDDLIISLTGTTGKEDYGYTVRIPKTNKKLLLNQRISKIIILNNKNTDGNYLLYYLLSRSFLDKLYKTAHGTRQANLSTDSIKAIKIGVPDIFRQKEIVKKLDLLSEQTKKLEENYKQKLLLLDELKKSVLQKAFSGNL